MELRWTPICKELSRLAQKEGYALLFEGARAVVTAVKGRLRERSLDVGNDAPVKRLLLRRPRPHAIICRNDHQAANLLVTLRELGKRVPEDLLVAGFNDVEYASILSPRECYLPAPLVERTSTALKKQ